MILRFIIKLTEDIVALFIALVFLKIAFKVTMGIDVLGDRSPKHRAKKTGIMSIYIGNFIDDSIKAKCGSAPTKN